MPIQKVEPSIDVQEWQKGILTLIETLKRDIALTIRNLRMERCWAEQAEVNDLKQARVDELEAEVDRLRRVLAANEKTGGEQR
jgi:hypothetical protein